MSTADKLLRTFNPPAGGWERLVQRRDKESWPMPVTALACAIALVVFAFPWPYRHRIEVQANGARLVGERSSGTTVRMLDGQQAIALPSGDPNVRLYWIAGGAQ
jgi:hypothetical protein